MKMTRTATIVFLVLVMNFGAGCADPTSVVENKTTVESGFDAKQRTKNLEKKSDVSKNDIKTDKVAAETKGKKSKKKVKRTRKTQHKDAHRGEEAFEVLNLNNVRANLKQAFEDSDKIMAKYGFKS